MSVKGPFGSSSGDDDTDLWELLGDLRIGDSPEAYCSDNEQLEGPPNPDELTIPCLRAALESNNHAFAEQIVRHYQDHDSTHELLALIQAYTLPITWHIRLFRAAKENDLLWNTSSEIEKIFHLAKLPDIISINEFRDRIATYKHKTEAFYYSLFDILENVKKQFKSHIYPVDDLFLHFLGDDEFWNNADPKVLLQFITISSNPVPLSSPLVIELLVKRIAGFYQRNQHPILELLAKEVYLNIATSIVNEMASLNEITAFHLGNILRLMIAQQGIIEVDFLALTHTLDHEGRRHLNRALKLQNDVHLYFLKNCDLHLALDPEQIHDLFKYGNDNFILGILDIPALVQFVGWHQIIKWNRAPIHRIIYTTPEYFFQLQIKDIAQFAEKYPKKIPLMLRTLMATPTLLSAVKPPRSMRWLGMAFDALCPMEETPYVSAYQRQEGINLPLIVFGLQYGAESAVKVFRFDIKIVDELTQRQLESIVTRQGRGGKFGEPDKKIPNDFLPDDVLQKLNQALAKRQKENKSQSVTLLQPIKEIGEAFYGAYRTLQVFLAKELPIALQSLFSHPKSLETIGNLNQTLLASAWAIKKSLKSLPTWLNRHPENQHLAREYDGYIVLMGEMANDLERTLMAINAAVGGFDYLQTDLQETGLCFAQICKKLRKRQDKLIKDKPQVNTLETRPLIRQTNS